MPRRESVCMNGGCVCFCVFMCACKRTIRDLDVVIRDGVDTRNATHAFNHRCRCDACVSCAGLRTTLVLQVPKMRLVLATASSTQYFSHRQPNMSLARADEIRKKKRTDKHPHTFTLATKRKPRFDENSTKLLVDWTGADEKGRALGIIEAYARRVTKCTCATTVRFKLHMATDMRCDA